MALALLSGPKAFGRDPRQVVKRALNGQQILRRSEDAWVIDFGVDMPLDEAMLYEGPFEYVKRVVFPERMGRAERRQRTHWWLHARPSPRYRAILRTQDRYIASPALSKHRVFIWLDNSVLADHQVVVFARDDDYFLGVLHSRAHELWTLRMCTWLGKGNDPRYTPSTTFETFPLPWPPGREPQDDPRLESIARAAHELVKLRDVWLHPLGADEALLRKRTLTNLYNQRPSWLALAHERLDHAVFDAYGWSHDISDEEILERLLRLNQKRATVVHVSPHIQRSLDDPDATVPAEAPDATAAAPLSDAG